MRDSYAKRVLAIIEASVSLFVRSSVRLPDLAVLHQNSAS